MVTVDNSRITYRYQVNRRIGAGGMGVVLEATDRLTQQLVALKRIHIPSTTLAFNSRQHTSDLQLALAQEFQMLATLRHPNIISVLDYGFDEAGQPFYTMELLTETDNLQRAAATRDTRGKVHLIIELLQALMYLHRRGIIHRDLKPGNVLLDATGTVRVLDFGLSQQPGDIDNVAGTMGYIAPELLQEKPLTPAADLYAVGVIAYQLFEGQHPFAPLGDSQLVVRVLTKMPTPLTSDIPDAVKHVIYRLLAKDPADRFASADAIIRALSDAVNEPLPPETNAQREGFIQAARFVGRNDEYQRLTHAVDVTLDTGAASTHWLIGGESGVGKSRLIDEIRTYALVNGVTVLSGQAQEGTQQPFHLWHSIVRELLLMTPIPAEDASIFQAIFGEIDTLLEDPIPPLPETVDNQQMLITYFAMLLERQTTPLLILLEDLQWADAGIALLEAMMQRSFQQVMIVGTYRNDEMPTLPERLPNAEVIRLERFSRREIAELSVSILGEAGKRSTVLDVLNEETQGNVFFIVEVIRALAENAGRLSAVGNLTIDQHIFTAGMRRIVQRRLDRVPNEYQSLLDLAALQGRLLNTDVLATVADTADALQAFLYACETAAVLTVRDDQWRFAHDKLREERLRLMPEVDKRARHRELATAIEATYDDLSQYTYQLATHWREADDPTRESPYLIRAAQDAFDNNLFKDAWNWMQRATTIDAWQYVDHTPADRARFLRQMGSAAYKLSRYDDAIRLHHEARDVAVESGDPTLLAEIIGSLGDICALTGDFDDATTYLTTALRYARDAEDDERIGVVLMNRGALEARRGNLTDAIDFITQSYDHLKRTDNKTEIAKALNNMAVASEFDDDYEAALSYHQQAMTLRRRLNDKLGIVSSARNIAHVCIEHAGDLARATNLLNEARRITDDLSLHEEAITLDRTYATLAEKQQRPDVARQHLLRSIKRARHINNPVFIGEQLFDLVRFERRQGNLSTAADSLREAIRVRHAHNHTRMVDELITYSAWFMDDDQRELDALTLLAYGDQADVLSLNDSLHDRYHALQQALPADEARAAIANGRTTSRDAMISSVLVKLAEC